MKNNTTLTAEMMGLASVKQIDQRWTELKQAFLELGNCWQKAGEIVCWLLDNDPDARDKFRAAGISPSVYNRLEKVGRGVLLPELAEMPRFLNLPIDEQKRIVQGKVQAVIELKDGTLDTIQVDVLRAEPEILNRVVAGNRIRTIEEQRRLLERVKPAFKKAGEACELPYKVLPGRKIEIIKPCILSVSDLTAITSMLSR